MYQNIPAELRILKQWVCSGKDKVPLNPRTGQYANVMDSSTWGTFDEAVSSARDYIGFVLTTYDDYAIIDLDNKPDKPLDEAEWNVHQRILTSFDSYTERSASGRGYHIVTKGRLPQGRRKGNVEVYSAERYMIFTGDVIRQAPITDCQALLDVLISEMKPAVKHSDLEQINSEVLDSEIVDIAMNAINGDKFTRLCNGDWIDNYNSQSEADFALMAILAFYTDDNEQVRRIFRMSKLGKRDKALRNDYLNYALSKIRANQPSPIDLDGVRQQAETVLLVSKDTKEEPKKEFVLMNPPGLVGEIAEYFYTSAIRPVGEIALAAAIALTAGIVGRSFNISGTGLNQYIILLAKTGSGKEGAMSGIEKLIASVRPRVPMIDQFLGPAAFSSGQALVKVLNEKPCFVSILGEFGMTLQDISDAKANTSQRMLKKVLLDLYAKSGHDSVLRASVYSDVEKNTKVVQAPNVTILGESTPETFFDGLNSTHVAEGLIPRFSIIQYKGVRPPRNRNAGQPPSNVLTVRFGELVASSLTISAKNTCMPVSLDAEATLILDEFDAASDKLMNKTQQDTELQLWNRAHLKALKMAGLIAVGVDPLQPTVNRQIAEWAIDFVKYDIEQIVVKFKQGEVGNGDEKQISDLRNVITQYYSADFGAVKSYGVQKEVFDMKFIPYSYLSRRLIGMHSFRTDRLGATNAIRKSILNMTESGILELIQPQRIKDANYKFQGVVYGIGKTGWF